MKNWKNYLTESNLFYTITGILYYFQIRLYMGVIDDVTYTYMHKVVDGHAFVDYTHQIGSLWEAMQSQGVDWFSGNGRFIVHTLVQWLCGVSYGREVYFVFCTFAFLALIAGMSKLITFRVGYSKYTKYWVLLLLLVLIPAAGSLLFGHMAYVINYLWTASVVIWALVFLYRVLLQDEKFSMWQSVFCWLFIAIAFAFQESFAIPVAGALCLCALVRYREWNGYKVCFLLAAGIGALLVIVAPSNFKRFEHSGGMGDSGMLMHLFTNATNVVAMSRLFLLCVALVLIETFRGKKAFVNFCSRYAFYLLVILLSFAFGTLITATGEHQFSIVAIMLIIIVLEELIPLLRNSRLAAYARIACCTVVSIMLLLYLPLYNVRSIIKTGWDDYVRSAQTEEYAHADVVYTASMTYPWWVLRYTNCAMARCHSVGEGTLMKWYLMSMSQNNTKMIEQCALPLSKEKIVDYCQSNPCLNENIWATPGNDGCIVRVPIADVDSVHVQYMTKPSFFGRMLGHKASENIYDFSDETIHAFVCDEMYYRWISSIDPKFIASIQVVR